MSRYIVKFLPKDISSPCLDPANATIKVGTFHHYRNIEDPTRCDREEGQRGLDLLVRKPSPRLDALIESELTAPQYDKNQIDNDGFFTFEYHILIHEHLYEFNSWVFCCSHIESLAEIDELKNNFESDKYYFITDFDSFVSRTQRAIASDLKKSPYLNDGSFRIVHKGLNNVFLDGYKDLVTYTK